MTVSTRRAGARPRLWLKRNASVVERFAWRASPAPRTKPTTAVRVTGAALATLAKHGRPWLSVEVVAFVVQVLEDVEAAHLDLEEFLSESPLNSAIGVGLSVVPVRDRASWRLLVRRAATAEASSTFVVALVVVQLVEVLHALRSALAL